MPVRKPVNRSNLLVLAALLLGAAAPVAKPDGELALTCLQRHQPVVNANSVAVSAKDGTKSFGACITYFGGTRSKSWWTKKTSTWTYIGAKPSGIPSRDVTALALALAKAALNVKP